MPSVSTMLYPTPGYVRVEINWADVTQATAAAVYRVDCETGVRTPLRPYVSYSGDYLTLSCGQAIFWDTEAPLDRCFYYCTQAIDSSGTVVTTASNAIGFDDFNRTNVDTWNTSSSGLVWTTSGGIAADYDVNGTQGTMALTSANVARHAWMDVGTSAFDIIVQESIPVVPAVAPIIVGAIGRVSSVTQFYSADAQVANGTGAVTLYIRRDELNAPHTDLGTVVTGFSVIAGQAVSIRFQGIGSQLRAKVWITTGPEPADWMLTVTDSTYLSQTLVGLHSVRAIGNTDNTTASFDNFIVTNPCSLTQTVETCSDDLIAPSGGDWRFGDPVRPCNDVILRNGGEVDPDCVPTQGVFFANMSADESYPAQTGTFLPTNSRYPIAVNRQRQATVATLTVVTRTFNDRDDLRDLNDPGSPLFLRGPAQYGINDRYMSVADVSENRPMSDHKITPRSITMPHLEVARPSGPTQGICGAQVDDLCDIYATWNALAASGLTWADLLRGKASNDTPIPDTVERTWADVNAGYADWNAVNAGNVDWDDLLDGA